MYNNKLSLYSKFFEYLTDLFNKIKGNIFMFHTELITKLSEINLTELNRHL